MRLQIKNKITHKRLTFIAALVFLEAFLVPINAILSQGLWPEPVQLAHCATTATLQITTMILGVLEKV